MNDDTVRRLLRRLAELERTSVKVRLGEVTDTGPLEVTLGGASVPFVDVKTCSTDTFTIGDQVATLAWGNDLIVLGVIA